MGTYTKIFQNMGRSEYKDHIKGVEYKLSGGRVTGYRGVMIKD